MSPSPMCSGAAAAAAALALLLGAALPATVARGEEAVPIPTDTVRSLRPPTYVPDAAETPAELDRWCAGCLAAGRARGRGREGGDLVFSAAWVRDRRLGEKAEAARLYVEAVGLYPPYEPAAGLAWIEVTRLRLEAGDPRAAATALEAAERLGGLSPPVDAPLAEEERWAMFDRYVQDVLPSLAVRLHETEGRYREAAAIAEAHAESEERRGRDASRRWARAARLRARAKDEAGARAAIDRALETVPDERRLAQYAFWRLHLRRGLLADDGAMGVVGTWPGGSLLDDVRVVLRGLPGNPHAGPYLLTLASSACASRRPEEALDLYGMALQDPAFLDAARDRPDLWRGLLVAFPVALELQRFDEAERILAAVERTGAPPPEEMDGYRLALAEARRAAEAAARAPPASDPPEASAASPTAPSPGAGRLLPPPPDERDEGVREADGEGPGSGPDPIVVVLLLAAAALAILVSRRVGSDPNFHT